ncbi:RING-H2 finger protein ATL74-like [Abrus precatorius]|uniref:RING-H2 finger protein ATL74-like n=1 Tax=Abrus precatorius TaxID=3816 RepID=A0A8B8L4Z0_ABRPR|nr:RING-H2 finger protein ATL74-like [Abrus precatorius]
MTITQEILYQLYSVDSSNSDMAHFTIFGASESSGKLKGYPLMLPNYNNFLMTFKSFSEDCIELLLEKIGIPQTYYNGHDCDMIDNILRMLCALVSQCEGLKKEYFCIYVMEFKGCCFYNALNVTSSSYIGRVPSREFVQKVACEGNFSLPAGASTLVRFKGDEEENCAICLGELRTRDNARLPCSHVCHYDCILEWFVKSGTCPLCRFRCNASSHRLSLPS